MANSNIHCLIKPTYIKCPYIGEDGTCVKDNCKASLQFDRMKANNNSVYQMHVANLALKIARHSAWFDKNYDIARKVAMNIATPEELEGWTKLVEV